MFFGIVHFPKLFQCDFGTNNLLHSLVGIRDCLRSILVKSASKILKEIFVRDPGGRVSILFDYKIDFLLAKENLATLEAPPEIIFF